MPMPFNRRRFVQGLATTAGALILPSYLRAAVADRVQTLNGPDFHLEISEMPVNLTGTPRIATVVNGQLPGPLLRMREGDDVTIRVTNRLSSATSIHWHGMIVPADMDGVPGISFHGIAPGTTFTYRFRVNQSGTYWYHAHSRFQEQLGLYGSIVVEPRDDPRHASDREHVLLLSDWTDRDPEDIYRTLKIHPGYFNFNKRTAADLLRETRRTDKDAAANRSMWNRMRMDPTDLSDVSGYAYTYLVNGQPPAANHQLLFKRGERVRLRLINGASMTFFDVRIPGLTMTAVAADGQDVEPVTCDEFRIGPAEVLDLMVSPKEDRAYTVFAQSMDRSGYARATLTPSIGMQAEVPEIDPPVALEMIDMGMAHVGMNHGTHEAHAMSAPPQHAPSEFGPGVDMRVDAPNNRLDDPGVGLRNNGRRVLTYADLHTLGGPIDTREPGRDVELHLTGHMERYLWSFNGQKFSESTPLRFKHGERLRLVLINDTMMTHPIHLHGMWSEVESPHGQVQLRKHTVVVQPAQRLAYQVTADALGRWAYHCHLLYHMEAGMFREVVVEHAGASS